MRALLISFTVLSLASGCNLPAGKDVSFITERAPVELKFPAGWHKSLEKHPYDLQCFSEFKDLSTGVFVYPSADLETGHKPQTLLQDHINDIRSKRTNFNVIEKETTTEHDGKRLTSTVYSGEKSGKKYNYRFTLIEFLENPDIHVVVIQTAFPSSWNRDKPILVKITESARSLQGATAGKP